MLHEVDIISDNMDPLQALQAAYSVPPDSKEQEEQLSGLRDYLEANPNYIPVLCSTLVRGLLNAQDSLLRRWTLDLLQYGICKANLPVEKRTERMWFWVSVRCYINSKN